MSEIEIDFPATPDGEPPAPPAAPPVRSLKKPLIVGAVLLGIGLWLVLALLPGILSRQPGAAATGTPGTAADARRIQANLFYVSADGAELVSVVREVPFGATPAEQARRIVEAQVRTPADGTSRRFRSGTKVRAVFLGAHGDAPSTSARKRLWDTRRHAGRGARGVCNCERDHINLPDVTAVRSWWTAEVRLALPASRFETADPAGHWLDSEGQ